ncbi:cytochrome c biogenesis CcdA family protein [Actinopolyspora mortivallis]|uniref:Cytochrome C biogenesis protein CcdA n=1 Tax=Actinopolyspora mortivallis TaxID=33906 RepID=A0A2T0GYK1_ACTMO|nr:cytochrome c biogenesis protein CcdA [Actinopolyspora mortivallis]PRW64198.1 cytochrome C biogenesis protein CcdA [Actinopolyspora mortivallis]
MSQVGLLGAFLGGLLTLVSPCSALLLPSFFAYAFGSPTRLLAHTTVFYVGLCTTLVPLGVASGLLGALFTGYRSELTLAGGLLLIGLGLVQLTGRGAGIGAAQRLGGRVRISSAASVLALGSVYGLAGFCAGPLLGGVLTVAATGASPGYGAVLLAVFALGMACPLFVLAALWERLGRRRWLRGREVRVAGFRVHTTNLVSGLLFVGMGVLFLTTEATAGLGGLVDTEIQYELGSGIRELSTRIANSHVLIAVAVGALLAMLWRRRRLVREEELRRGRPCSQGGRERNHR